MYRGKRLKSVNFANLFPHVALQVYCIVLNGIEVISKEHQQVKLAIRVAKSFSEHIPAVMIMNMMDFEI